MKIEYVNRKTVKFEDLKIGQIFFDPSEDNSVYMKVRNAYSCDIGAVDLREGEVYDMTADTEVLPLNTTLKVEN
jgi:hypothetical protein